MILREEFLLQTFLFYEGRRRLSYNEPPKQEYKAKDMQGACNQAIKEYPVGGTMYGGGDSMREFTAADFEPVGARGT